MVTGGDKPWHHFNVIYMVFASQSIIHKFVRGYLLKSYLDGNYSKLIRDQSISFSSFLSSVAKFDF